MDALGPRFQTLLTQLRPLGPHLAKRSSERQCCSDTSRFLLPGGLSAGRSYGARQWASRLRSSCAPSLPGFGSPTVVAWRRARTNKRTGRARARTLAQAEQALLPCFSSTFYPWRREISSAPVRRFECVSLRFSFAICLTARSCGVRLAPRGVRVCYSAAASLARGAALARDLWRRLGSSSCPSPAGADERVAYGELRN